MLDVKRSGCDVVEEGHVGVEDEASSGNATGLLGRELRFVVLVIPVPAVVFEHVPRAFVGNERAPCGQQRDDRAQHVDEGVGRVESVEDERAELEHAAAPLLNERAFAAPLFVVFVGVGRDVRISVAVVELHRAGVRWWTEDEGEWCGT